MSQSGAANSDQHTIVERPSTSGMAVLSVVLSVLGFTCMWGFGGLLGIALGVMAKGEIERSEGKTRGARLAVTGIALGSLNLLVCVLAVGIGIAYLARPRAFTPPSKTAAGAPLLSPRSSPAPNRASGASAGKPGEATMSKDTGLIVTKIGKIDLVDLGSDVRSLGEELDKQRLVAERDKKKLVVWLIEANCKPCNGVAASLPDRSMQTALEGVRLVRLDPDDFRLELKQFNIPTDKIPGFALLGADNHPLDYLHGGEWNEDIPRNIAPVLGQFVRGVYRERREPWRGGARDDETPL